MKISTEPQGSPGWMKERLGIPTASQFKRIIQPSGRATTGNTPRTYMHELAYERLTGKPYNRDLSNIAHVQYGIVNEPKAVEAFEKHTGIKTEPTTLHTLDDGSAGASPDRLIAGKPDQALECKVPKGHTHVGYLMHGLDDYWAQLQGQIWICELKVVHFFSWHEEFPPFHLPVGPDDGYIRQLAKLVAEFNKELAEGVAHVRQLGHWPANAPSIFPAADEGPP